jgi:hypothetical protein
MRDATEGFRDVYHDGDLVREGLQAQGWLTGLPPQEAGHREYKTSHEWQLVGQTIFFPGFPARLTKYMCARSTSISPLGFGTAAGRT